MMINNTIGVTPMNDMLPLEGNNNVVDLNARVSTGHAQSVPSTKLTAHDIDNFYRRIQSSSLSLEVLTEEINNITLEGKPLSIQQQNELLGACLARAKNDQGEKSEIYSLLNKKLINVISFGCLMNSYMTDIISSKSGNPMIDDELEDDSSLGVW